MADAENIMAEEGMEHNGTNIMQTIKTIMLTLQLVDEKCFKTLAVDSNYFDAPCLKLVSKTYTIIDLVFVVTKGLKFYWNELGYPDVLN